MAKASKVKKGDFYQEVGTMTQRRVEIMYCDSTVVSIRVVGKKKTEYVSITDFDETRKRYTKITGDDLERCKADVLK